MVGILSIAWVFAGICILCILNLKFKMHNLLALLLAGIFIAVMEKIPIDNIVKLVQDGIGGIMGHLALIIIFGAIIGKFMAESGASQKIADTVISKCGTKYLPIGLLFIGTIFGISMFYEVAFLICAPLVLNIAKKSNVPYMKLIIPVVAGATMGHSIFPPQPGPMALVTQLHADIVQVYGYGLIVIIPSIFCAGFILPKFLPGIKSIPLNSMIKLGEEKKPEELPSFGVSILIPLIPAVLIIACSVIKSFSTPDSLLSKNCDFWGSADISMFIATLCAMWLLGYKRGIKSNQLMDYVSSSISSIANVIFVISAGGILKEVIISSGTGDNIVSAVSTLSLSPYIIAWLITATIRILTGQGAVAAITTAGIVAPMVTAMHLDPVLMCLVVACGSNTITLMYDGGFLLFKETFGISMKDTFKTWGLLELVNSVVGLIVILIVSTFI